MDPSKQPRSGPLGSSTAFTGSRKAPPPETKSGHSGRGPSGRGFGRGRGSQGRGSAPSDPISHDGATAGSREAPSREAKSGGRGFQSRARAVPRNTDFSGLPEDLVEIIRKMDYVTIQVLFNELVSSGLVTIEFLNTMDNVIKLPECPLNTVGIIPVVGENGKFIWARDELLDLLLTNSELFYNQVLTVTHSSDGKNPLPLDKYSGDFFYTTRQYVKASVLRALLRYGSVRVVMNPSPYNAYVGGDGPTTYKKEASSPQVCLLYTHAVCRGIEDALRIFTSGCQILMNEALQTSPSLGPNPDEYYQFANPYYRETFKSKCRTAAAAYRQGFAAVVSNLMVGDPVQCMVCGTDTYYPKTRWCTHSQSLNCSRQFH